ncbi:hypothetical protein [Fodinicola feengrottensis]|uniref:Uncharacterized protein n=1 Tax=Fodinicola feengrottensis TaxID=435914 RepID=A0ABN2H1J6_9ACTN|nr:hypothetical protein [Fodinicola feengrottensis]
MVPPVVRAKEWDDTSWDDPSEEKLHDLLADLNLRSRFVIVDRLDREPEGQHYMQAYLNDDLSYTVEYRDGGEDRHFRAEVPAQPTVIGCEPVARVVNDWIADGPNWRQALAWSRIRL